MEGPKIIITGEDRFTGKMESVQKRMRSMGESLSNVSGTIISKFIAPTALGLVATMKVGSSLEDTFNRISVNTGLAGEALKKYKDRVLDLATSVTSTFRPLEVADTVADLIQAGFDEESAMAAMPSVMKASQAAAASLKDTSLGLINTMTQFKLPATEANRILNATAVASNITKSNFADLREGMKNAGPIAKAFTVDYERALAIVAQFQQGGILPAESGTAFRSLELAMTKPVGRAVEIWKQAKDQFGIDPRDINGNLRDPIKVITELAAAMESKHLGSGDKGYILTELFGSYASTAVMAIINDIANGAGILTDKIEAEIKRQSNLLNAAAETRSKGGRAAFMKAWSELEVQLSRMYDKSLVDRMTRVLGRFQLMFKAIGSLDKERLDTLLNLFITIAGFTISAAVIARLLTAFANIKSIATILTATFGAGPAAAIVAGIAVVVAAMVKLMDTIPKLTEKKPYMDQVTGETDLAVAFLQPIYDAWKQITDETQSAIDKKAEYLKMTGDEKRAERAMQANKDMLEAIEKAQGFKANWGRALDAAGTVVGDAMLRWNDDFKNSKQTPFELSLLANPVATGASMLLWYSGIQKSMQTPYGHSGLSNPVAMGAAANQAVQTILAPGMAQSARNVQERYNSGKYEAHVVFDNAPSGMRVIEKTQPSGQFNFFTSFNRGVSMGTP